MDKFMCHGKKERKKERRRIRIIIIIIIIRNGKFKGKRTKC
jgi:hypothetical protein